MTIGDKYRTSKYRVGRITLLDLIPTIIASFIIALIYDIYVGKQLRVLSVLIAFVLLMIVAIMAHVATKTPTTLNYWLGISKCPKLSGKCTS